MCSLGIEPTTFCAADAMLYHWATQEHNDNFTIHKNISKSTIDIHTGKADSMIMYYKLDLTTRNEEKNSRNKENCTWNTFKKKKP